MIGTYTGIKGFLSQYVLGDPRIPEGGFLWGDSKRIMDAIASGQIYPYFWVEDFKFRGTENSLHEQIYVGWQLDISIKANAQYGDVQEEEQSIKLCHNILYDFIAWLEAQHQDERIYFDFKRFNAWITTGDESDNNCGWSFTIMIGEWPEEFCPPEEDTRNEVQVFQPVFVEGESNLELVIDGESYTQVWTEEDQAQSAIEKMVQEINLTETDVKASTDDTYLYLITQELTSSILIESGVGHDFIKPFDMN